MENLEFEILTEEGYKKTTFETFESEAEIEKEIDLDFSMFESQTSNKSTAGAWQKIKIVSVGNWPEYAMKTVKRCWKENGPLGIKITVCGKFDTPHRRNCSKTLYVKYRITSPDQKIKKDIEDCVKKSAIVAAGGFAISGIPGAISAFKGTFEVCLDEKLGSLKNFVDYKLDTDSSCGKWTPY